MLMYKIEYVPKCLLFMDFSLCITISNLLTGIQLVHDDSSARCIYPMTKYFNGNGCVQFHHQCSSVTFQILPGSSNNNFSQSRSLSLATCLSSFLCYCDKILGQKQCEGEMYVFMHSSKYRSSWQGNQSGSKVKRPVT